MKPLLTRTAPFPDRSVTVKRSFAIRVISLAFVMTAVGASCGIADDGYTYVNNQQEKFFFKLPDTWNKHKAGKADPGVLKTAWTLYFDSTKTSKKANKLSYEASAPSVPSGIAQVFNLTPAGTDIMNEITLRSMVFGPLGSESDPVKLAQDDPRVEILRYDRFMSKKGQWGSTIVINVNLGEEAGKMKWVTMAQKAIYDPKRQAIYRVGLKCTQACYAKNKKTLKQILDSLQVQR